jgi:hypothetical protein
MEWPVSDRSGLEWQINLWKLSGIWKAIIIQSQELKVTITDNSHTMAQVLDLKKKDEARK